LDTEIYDPSQKWPIINSVAGLHNPEFRNDEIDRKSPPRFPGNPKPTFALIRV